MKTELKNHNHCNGCDTRYAEAHLGMYIVAYLTCLALKKVQGDMM